MNWVARPIAAAALILAVPGLRAQEPLPEPICPPSLEVSEDSLDRASERRAERLDGIRAYLAARSAARQGDREAALEGLQLLDRIGADMLPGPQEPFSQWAGDEDFATVLARMRERFGPTDNGHVAMEVDAPPITAEGMAYDAGLARLFLSNWRDNSIYTLTLGGQLELYLALDELTPNGMAIDQKNRQLWFAATNAFHDKAEEPRSELWRVDLATGEATQFAVEAAAGFNDVAVSAFGNVYVSDTPGREIYVLEKAADKLRPLMRTRGMFQQPNGLAVDDSGRYLFVAQGLDLLRIDLYDLAVTEIAVPLAVETLGTDGLYFRDGKLYAIQNLLTPGTLVEIGLDGAFTRAVSYRVLERANPKFDLPTTGTFVGDRFWMMASTQLYLYGAGKEPAAEDINPLTILEYGPCSAR